MMGCHCLQASLVGSVCESRTLNGMRIETLAVHAGRSIDPSSGAVTPPIHLSTTFERSKNGDYPLGFSYSREDNPNRRLLEQCLAALEGGKEALVLSSGLAVLTRAGDAAGSKSRPKIHATGFDCWKNSGEQGA